MRVARVTVRVTVTASLGVFGLAASLGTLRTVMYAVWLRWLLPDEYRDGDAITAAIEQALAVDGYR